jgi:hypothetical protein
MDIALVASHQWVLLKNMLPEIELYPRFDTGSLAGIGIDISYWYWSVGISVGILCTVRFGGSSILWNFARLLFVKYAGIFFHQKKGAEASLRGEKGVPAKTFWGKKGFPPICSTKRYQKVPTEFSSGIGMVNTEKYRPNTDRKYPSGIQL